MLVIRVVPFLPFFDDVLWHWHAGVIWHADYIFEVKNEDFEEKKLSAMPNWKFLKCMESQKIKMSKSFQTAAYNMQNDEGTPNLAAEFKSDNIWSPFGPKNGQN